DETVLEAALRTGFDFPFSCGSATCGTCMGKVLQGTFTYGQVQPYALDEQQQSEGFALFCSVRPTSDLVIEVDEVYGPEYRPARKFDYHVRDFKLLNDNIYQVFLTAQKNALEYQAGQYLQILCDDGTPIPFSIANAPDNNKHIELQIKSVSENVRNVKIIEKITQNKDITLRGPYGATVYKATPMLPIIYLAGGTGIVPIKAMLEAAFANNDPRQLHLYWGVKNSSDLYLTDLFTEWAVKHANFSFTPVITVQDAYWQGRTGLVHEVVVEQHKDLSGYQVYASGPKEMVYAAYDEFTAKGLKQQLMFSDTFEYFPQTLRT
ncbi:MAG: 2Fe-2S iron-sulfur cluster binding domain-containing protein, partial [Gammaproteobacteria bacterium]|nr:2Fe-2S iron-sulfur cluster binding domain-containing protein [Gammaproteobacteria bacterium]